MKFSASFSPPTLRTAPGSPLLIVKSRSLKTEAGQFLCKTAATSPIGAPIFLPPNIPVFDLDTHSLILWDDGSGLLLHPDDNNRALPIVVELNPKLLDSPARNAIKQASLYQKLKTDSNLKDQVSKVAQQLSTKYSELRDGWAPGQVPPFFRRLEPAIDKMGHNPKSRKLVQSLHLMTRAYPEINSVSLRCGVLSGPTKQWLLAPKINVVAETHTPSDVFQKIKTQANTLLCHFVDGADVSGQTWNGKVGGIVAHKTLQGACMNERWVHFSRAWFGAGQTPQFSTTHERLSLLKDLQALAPELVASA